MNPKLHQIQNWPHLARQANWSATTLAKLCGVSKDTLRRHFFQHIGKTPKGWLGAERQRQAVALLRDGCSVKEISACLGYSQQTNFTRRFKSYWGACPSQQPLRMPLSELCQNVNVAAK